MTLARERTGLQNEALWNDAKSRHPSDPKPRSLLCTGVAKECYWEVGSRWCVFSLWRLTKLLKGRFGALGMCSLCPCVCFGCARLSSRTCLRTSLWPTGVPPAFPQWLEQWVPAEKKYTSTWNVRRSSCGLWEDTALWLYATRCVVMGDSGLRKPVHLQRLLTPSSRPSRQKQWLRFWQFPQCSESLTLAALCALLWSYGSAPPLDCGSLRQWTGARQVLHRC